MKRLFACWSIVLFAIVLGATPAWSAEPSIERLTSQSLADPAGDVVDSGGGKLTDARGDILEAAARYDAGAVQFEVRMARFTDPVKDPNWNSDSTYLLWTLDTNGDQDGDYTVEYGNEDGKVYGAVFEVGATDDAPSICTSPSLPAGPSGAYMLRLDSGCFGRPGLFAWSVEASYDTNSRDEEAPATEDIVPDTGFSAPLYAPAGSPVGAASGTPKSSPNRVTSSAGATAGGQNNAPSEAGAAATAVSSSEGTATGGGAPGSTEAETGSSSASASATAVSSSDPGAASRGASGAPAAPDARVNAAADASADPDAPQDESGMTLLIAIIVGAAVVLVAVVGVLVRTLRSRDATVSAEV